MKFKNISKILAATMLLSNPNLSSFAGGTLSDDGRYETFEGDSIEIDNVLEEDEVNVEVEGNTMVNLVQCSNVNITVPQTGFKQARIGSNKQIKPLTTYTIIYWAKKTDNHNPVIDNSRPPIQLVFGGSHASDNWGSRYYPHNGEIKDYHVGKFTTPTDYYNETNGEFILIGEYSRGSSFDISIVVLEGDWTNKELPKSYFEGLKSVGEDSDISIEASNKNLFNLNTWTNVEYANNEAFNGINHDNNTVTITAKLEDTYTYTGAGGMNTVGDRGKPYLIKVKPNTKYTISYTREGLADGSNFLQEYNDKYENLNLKEINCGSGESSYSATFTTTSITKYIGIRFGVRGIGNTVTYSEIQLEESGNKTDYNPYEVDKIELKLKKPLRGIEGGVKDRIVKINNQWFVERNCGELVFDGSSDENWVVGYGGVSGNQNKFEYSIRNNILSGTHYKSICNRFNFEANSAVPSVGNFRVQYDSITNKGIYFLFNISTDVVPLHDVNAWKQWIAQNPLKVVYQLPEAIYEPLNIKSEIRLFEGNTYIKSNSNIPVRLKVTVDRTANRAKEALEVVKSNPTAANIAQARYWTNLLKDSTLKDDFQEQITTSTTPVDLAIEKKTTSANIDVYVKMKNSLSLSLDTNYITFEDFNASEDMEKKNAVNLIVSSSLPYKVNASLESEIYNADKSATIDKSVLNIKNSNDTTYKAFNRVSEALVLLDNQIEGDNISHSLDLILRGGSTHKPDAYKTTLKFEVEQK